MNVARTIEIEGDQYVNVGDLIAHLTVCSESVVAFCGDESVGAKIVSETLEQTISTLRSLV